MTTKKVKFVSTSTLEFLKYTQTECSCYFNELNNKDFTHMQKRINELQKHQKVVKVTDGRNYLILINDIVWCGKNIP